MSMSQDGFKAYLKPYIEKGEAFSAYWHPKGFGLLKTGPQPRTRQEYIVHVSGQADKRFKSWSPAQALWQRNKKSRDAWIETVEVDDKPKTLPESARKRWAKNLDQLRRDSWGPVITVEFDGNHLAIEGGDLEI